MSEQSLFSEFEAVSAKAWKQKIQYELKGADYNEKLVWESPDGIKVKPFYNREDLKGLDIVDTTDLSTWKIAEAIFVADVSKSNKKALQVLDLGAESIFFEVTSETTEPQQLFTGIDTNAVPVHLSLHFLSPLYTGKVLKTLGAPSPNLHLHCDPIGHLAGTGNWFTDMPTDLEQLQQTVALVGDQPVGSLFSVDTALYQQAGATMVQQLAYALGHANEYLNRYTANPFPGLLFKVAVGGNYFFEIAKLKALRLLWKALAAEYGVATDCHILATPSRRNKTIYAYNNNMLRSTAECMSAILGGADTVNNLPYDSLYHKNNTFGDRIARNQLLLLKYESYFKGLPQPVKGSYYIETLTRQLAEKALALFKTIEAAGGFLQQLKDHTIQRKIKESAEKEQSLFDAGKEVLIGTNRYLHRQEHMRDNLDLYPFVKTHARKTLIEPIIPKRLAEVMEQKRLQDEN